MKKNRKRVNPKMRSVKEPLDWLPFDPRIIPDIFRFTYVKGFAKFFLLLEITLALLVVLGTLLLVGMKITALGL
jgi:hypothetical protein